MMSVNDALYWQLPDETMKAMGQAGAIAGREDVDRQTDPPTVKARAVNFPVLIHELIKGTLELVALHGRKRDEEGNEEDFTAIEDSEDTLEKEMWDLRLGPAIWDRIRQQMPEDILTDESKVEIQNYLLMAIFQLPAKKFLVLCKEIISGGDSGKRLLSELTDNVVKKLNDQEIEDLFNSDLDELTDQTDNDDLKDFISGIPGISLSNDDEDDDDSLFDELGLDRPTK
jgi:hypothetical protein